MRRKQIVITIILLLPSCLFALMSHVGPNHKTIQDSLGMTIYGFVSEDDNTPMFSLKISDPLYPSPGFNLDVMDGNNPLQYEIAPSSQPLSLAGAIIGTFSVISSGMNELITITHTPLRNLDPNEVGVTVDWELAIGWDEITDNGNGDTVRTHRIAFCLSKSEQYSDIGRKIEISLDGGSSTDVHMLDAHIYFRLSSNSPVTRPGTYEATIKFEVSGT